MSEEVQVEENGIEQAQMRIDGIISTLTRKGKTIDDKDQARWERWRASKVGDHKDDALVAALPNEYCNEFRPLGTVLGRLSLKGIHSFKQLPSLEEMHPDITKNLSRIQQDFLEALIDFSLAKREGFSLKEM